MYKKTSVLLAAAVAITSIFYKSFILKPKPYVLVPAPGKENNTIFVSIPSYRDRLCMDTIRELFSKADNPNRVFVGVCDQRPLVDEQEGVIERCHPDPPFAYDANVQVFTIHHLATKGLTHARYQAGRLYRGEDYFLAIDAHSKFTQGWDTDVIAMLEATPNPSKSVITHYPREIEELDNEPDTIDDIIPCLCLSEYEEEIGLPNFKAKFIPQSKSYLQETPFLAGGMYFSKGTILKDVPLDPGLNFLFVGVEILFAVRLWTSGYTLYTPTKNVIFHKYERKDVPYFHTDMRETQWLRENEKSVSIARRILHFEKPFFDTYQYGLGPVRTLDAYYSYAGIDPITKKTRTSDIFCPDPLRDQLNMFFYKVNQKVRGGSKIILFVVLLNVISVLFICLIIIYFLRAND